MNALKVPFGLFVLMCAGIAAAADFNFGIAFDNYSPIPIVRGSFSGTVSGNQIIDITNATVYVDGVLVLSGVDAQHIDDSTGVFVSNPGSWVTLDGSMGNFGFANYDLNTVPQSSAAAYFGLYPSSPYDYYDDLRLGAGDGCPSCYSQYHYGLKGWITAVPLPAGAALLGSGLFGLAGLGGSRKAAQLDKKKAA